MTTKYRAVLRFPGSLRLLSSGVLARFPQGMSSLAILLLVRDATHSYAAAGIAVGAFTFATAVAAPLLGRLVDRLGRRAVLRPVACGQALAYLLLVAAASARAGALVLVPLAGLAGALLPPIAPVVRALLRELFDDPTVRETAYALEAVAQEIIWIVGPLVIALVITVFSPKAAVLMLAGTCSVGTWLFLNTPLVATAGRRSEVGHQPGSALRSPDLRWLLCPVALSGAAIGAVEIGLPSLAVHAGSRPAAGLLLAMWSIGSMTGGVWYSSRTWSSSLGSRYFVLLMSTFLCTASLLTTRSIAGAAVCSFVAGLAIAPTFSCQYALVAHVVASGSENEAFSWTSSGLIGGIAAGAAIGGAVIRPAGIRAPFLIACLTCLLAAVIASRFRGRFAPAGTVGLAGDL